MKISYSVNTYKASRLTAQNKYPLGVDNADNAYKITVSEHKTENSSTLRRITFTAKKNISNTGVSIVYEADNHTLADYIFAPSALYNGNRFHSVERKYAPMYNSEDIEMCKKGPVITDVPRLFTDATGKAQLNSGDLATPCAGFYCEASKQGFIMFFTQKNEAGNFGLTVCEDLNSGTVCFQLSAPCMREKYKYGMCTTKTPSDDRPLSLKQGDTLTFEIEEYTFPCESKTEYLNFFFRNRVRKNLKRSHPEYIPWSYAFNLLEEKYNKRNWLDDPGFYKSSEAGGKSVFRQWQTGWVGGAMNTLPGLFIGNSESVEKSKKTLDFVFDKIQHSSGFLYGIFCDGKPYGDCFGNESNASLSMSRKNADALYFIAKQLLCLQYKKEEIPFKWKNGLHRLADAFIGFYDKNHDLAQFIDMDKNEPFAPYTASAAIAPAGLALCALLFNDKKYLDYACEIAQKYYDEYVKEGFTNGGPGEILGCPDSESAFGMLESLIVLYSSTKNEKWLGLAADTASLCSSWCVSYDYEYEKDTQWYKRGIATTGAVWASVQNKHAAPGICTLSGASLFRLFRATGDIEYLELCRDISHNITQFISTPENPMRCSYVWTEKNAHRQKQLNDIFAKALIRLYQSGKIGAKLAEKPFNIMFNAPGRIGERCNLSDWEGKANVGELPGGSCWCEVSAMLTYFELPCVYVNTDTAFTLSLDHVKSKIENGKLILENPTDYDADYRIFAETEKQRKIPLEETYMIDFKTVSVPAHKTVSVKI